MKHQPPPKAKDPIHPSSFLLPPSPKPRARSPASIATQELVVAWQASVQRSAFSVQRSTFTPHQLDLLTSSLTGIISNRIKWLLKRKPFPETSHMDQFQDAFVAVWNALPNYNPVECAITTWVYKRTDSQYMDNLEAAIAERHGREKLAGAVDALDHMEPTKPHGVTQALRMMQGEPGKGRRMKAEG